MSDDGLPILPHVSGEFYVWLWWASEVQSAQFELEDPVGAIDLWCDGRLAFRIVGETKVTATMTGESSSTSLEARAALAGGKILQEIKVFIRRDEREFSVTLKGPEMHLTAVKLPQVMSDGAEEVLYDRMFLYAELTMIVGTLFNKFAKVRVSDDWEGDTLPTIRKWVWASS